MKFAGRIALLLLCSVAIGCEQADTGEEAVVAETPDDTAPNAVEVTRKDARFGKSPARLLLKQAEALDLSDAQRTAIEAMRADLKQAKKTSGKWEAKRALDDALADGIRAGNLDRELLGTHVASMKEAMGKKHDNIASALVSLHETLSPEQRTLLVAAAREHIADKMGGSCGDKGRDEGVAKDGLGKSGKLLRHVSLNDEQRQRFEAAVAEMRTSKPSHEAMKQRFADKRAQTDAMFDAFQTDRFDASAVVDGGTDRFVAKVEHRIEAVAALLPILTDAQRVELAEGLARKGKTKQDRGLPAL